jgi:ABC-2 type transport system ATP-binding protein
MAGDTVFETRNLTKIFKDFWRRDKVRAVDGVDLKVESGEVFGLLGPNGSGKSTIVKMALGLLYPTRGYAAVFGRPPGSAKNKDRIGFLPEETYLYRYLDAESALDFYGKLFNLTRPERKRRTASLIEMVGLTAARNRPLKEYSKGMARRIGLAQALIGDPELLFLDEPTAGLDPIGTREMKDLIIDLKNRGKTIFLCSHLLADVEDVCDRITILYGGKICSEGTVAELLARTDTTQITAPALSDEAIREVAEIIRREAQAEPEITSPVERLESFFLRVIRQAREQRAMTAGVAAGAGTPEFLGTAAEKPAEEETPSAEKEDVEAKRKRILDDLTQPKEG